MLISDWSSDVCSSDLIGGGAERRQSLCRLNMIQPTRFLDLRDGNGKIAIAYQRGGYQLFQPRVAKEIPPPDLHRALAKRGITSIAGGVVRRSRQIRPHVRRRQIAASQQCDHQERHSLTHGEAPDRYDALPPAQWAASYCSNGEPQDRSAKRRDGKERGIT